jgi:hypothetical protein
MDNTTGTDISSHYGFCMGHDGPSLAACSRTELSPCSLSSELLYGKIDHGVQKLNSIFCGVFARGIRTDD